MNRPLRVLRVIARLNVGGPARHVTILDKGLRARGVETLLAYGEIGSGEASLEHLSTAAQIPARRVPGLGRRMSPFSDLRALTWLIETIFRLRPDVVHTHTAKAGSLGRIAALLYNLSRRRSARCLVVHTFHGHVLHGYFGPVASALVRTVERALGKVTDCVFVLSQQQRKDIADRYHIAPQHRVHIVPLGLELEALLSLPERSHDDDTVVFGFVGRFVPIKNLPLLIAAFAAVHAEAPRTRLVLVGDGEEAEPLRSMVAERGLGDAVEFAGWREDLTDVYAQIHVLVLTSSNEGTPVAVIEAMAAGLPVVTTEVGGVPDVVTQRSTGILVPSGAVEPLAAAMLELVRNPHDRRRLGAAARAAVRTRFAPARLVSDVASLYERELRAKRHST